MRSITTRWSAAALAVWLLLVIGYLFSTRTPEKTYTIGVLNYSKAAEPALKGLIDGLAKLGYQENKNLRVIYHGSITDEHELRHEGERLLALNIDLLYTMSTPATLAAKDLTAANLVPVVFGPVSSPVQAGIVRSFQYPGGNITGVSFGEQEPQRLNMLVKIVPGVKKVFVPYNPENASAALGINRLTAPAENLGLTLLTAPVLSRQILSDMLTDLPKDVDAIFVPTDSFMVDQTDMLMHFADLYRIPLSTPQREQVAAGALFSYGFSIYEAGNKAAHIAHQVFQGTNPGDIPVELAEFVLTVNLATARKLGVTVPEDLLRHAIIYR